MNFRKGRHAEEPEINLIPFIDVLLVIMIFLMISTTYSKMTALKINLPTADAEKAITQPLEIHVEVDAQGRYAINGKATSAHDAATLSAALRETAQDAKDPIVIINADAMAAHQTVINVLEAAQTAGLSKITFAAQKGK